MNVPFLCLSHPIRSGIPVYPSAPDVRIRPHRLIRDGGQYNSYVVEMFNHCGTHVDAPRHVFNDGPALTDFPLDELVFDSPRVISISASDHELIGVSELEKRFAEIQDCDFLAIRTGFSVHRDRDPTRFATRNPGLSPQAASWLINTLPDLRGLGLDVISVTAGGEAEEGWRSHRILLDPSTGRRLVVEDMRLPPDLARLNKLWVVPLFVDGVDSSWCTVIGESTE